MADGAKGPDQTVSGVGGKDRFGKVLRRLLLAAFLLLPLGLLALIGQQLWYNSLRQAQIEKREFGASQEEREEDYSAETFQTETGEIILYFVGTNRNSSALYFDEASDFTLVDPKSGKQRKIASDDRRVISFQTIERLVETQSEDEAEVQSASVAYVARIAKRKMYLDGKSDLIVGSFNSLEQRLIAENVHYLDVITIASDQSNGALVFWDDARSAQRVVFDLETLETLEARPIELPLEETFVLEEPDEESFEVEGTEAAAQAGLTIVTQDKKRRPR